ncbi:MAG TPA: hypothetical protein ENK70_01320, partial [Methylophaga sp.]|nr:hypothetical protein [Methylophaga sp.]
MPGLKQTIFNDKPKTFWSFDHDNGGGDDDGIVLDEIDNLNPLAIAGENYLLAQQSLNDLELIDQASVRVAKDEKLNGQWSNFWLEAQHSTSYFFPNLGSFSVEFMYSKKPVNTIRNSTEPGWYKNVYSPLIKKGNILN